MGLTVEDLRPKNFKINIRGVELECKPPRLSHTLAIAKVGDIFSRPLEISADERMSAQKDMDMVISDLIPQLAEAKIELSAKDTIDLIEQIMNHTEPSDNKYLSDKGVKFDVDPKAGKIG